MLYPGGDPSLTPVRTRTVTISSSPSASPTRSFSTSREASTIGAIQPRRIPSPSRQLWRVRSVTTPSGDSISRASSPTASTWRLATQAGRATTTTCRRPGVWKLPTSTTPPRWWSDHLLRRLLVPVELRHIDRSVQCGGVVLRRRLPDRRPRLQVRCPGQPG